MIRILFLSANPDNADTLLAGDELRQIEAALKGSRFEVIAKPAARLDDLPDLLRQSQAAIVHFSGHGSRYGELMFVNEQGESQSASIPALAKLFELFKGQVRCVVLNACYSDEQAAAIAEQVECVLGFAGAIRDDAARAFARGFYGALAAGETLARAKGFGLNEIERRYPEALLPCHLAGQGDANTLRPAEWEEVEETNAPPPTNQFHTAGGTAIAGDANIGGDFVNRDKIEGDKVEGDKVTGNKTVIQQQIIYQTTSPDLERLAIRNSQFAIRGIFGQYPFNEHFFGRNDELAELHALLQTQNTVSICPVITGMGGLGKTQLAAHYARRHEANYPDGIFWVTAADLNAIRGQLADFCVTLGLPVADPQRTGDLSEQKITAFKHYLDEHPNALLIFDNVEEPDHLRTRQIGVQMTALTLGGKLIVTTRRRKLSIDRFVELPLQRLLPEPARQILLTARAELAQDPDLNRLCEQFGYLPLMLNLAAAALKKRGGAIVGYLQRLHTLGAEKLHNDVAKVSLDDYHKSLSAVLQEQWAMLQDENARLLFRIAGQLPEAEVIPNARLGLLAGLQDVDEWEQPLSDALEELERASLIEPVDAATLRLHPLVCDFAEGLTPATERDNFRSQCAQNLANAYATSEKGLRRLGNEYAARGIAAILIDLITAIYFAQSAGTNPQSPVSSLQSLLRLLRLEANKLQPSLRRPEQLWQQLLPRMPLSASNGLTQALIALLQRSLHWLPHWGQQRNSPALEQTLTGHKDTVDSMAVLDANRIVSASGDRTIKVWNLATGSVEQTLSGHERDVNAVAVIDSQRIVSASDDRTLKVWNLESGALEQTLRGHKFSVSSVAVIDSQRIVSASYDGRLKVWNLQIGAVEQTLRGHKSPVRGLAVIDSQRIVSASHDNTLKVWNLQIGAVEQTLRGHKDSVSGVAVIDWQRIVSSAGGIWGSDNTLKVWNLQSGAVEQTLRGTKTVSWQ
ncbi:MAG: NB-ARC domain-containing protein [Caldilineaceae bacterium]